MPYVYQFYASQHLPNPRQHPASLGLSRIATIWKAAGSKAGGAVEFVVLSQAVTADAALGSIKVGIAEILNFWLTVRKRALALLLVVEFFAALRRLLSVIPLNQKAL